ncbi:beta-1,3-galactosyltransferase brn-like [Ylistrum balloti]|uniref:beta-1,3-galactosyltransferase brn-like n=1 Tax=Ylistrum balloti TaxID=509963 RepID=UPI0029058317|nr:beta-1,3-galactosyltransferase brn-like [Ylistrum balloti]
MKFSKYLTQRVMFVSLLAIVWVLCALIGIHVSYMNKLKPYSEFTYPTETDFISLYQDFKKYGGLPKGVEEINPHPFNYMHLKEKCEFKSEKDYSLLILVKSAVSIYQLRDGIRAIWGKTRGDNIVIVYVLGYRPEHQLKIDEEASLHGDIIQESFTDAYSNNAYKTIMGFSWAVKYCHKASHIMFVDDDHYLVLSNIMIYIRAMCKSNNANLMVGYAYFHQMPHMYKLSKWYVTIEEYPFDKYPPYLTAGAYIVSQEVANKLVFAFPYVKYFWIDDIYLSIVSHKLGMIPQHEPRFYQPSFLLYTDPKHMVYHDFKTKEAFLNVEKILRGFPNESSVSKMCKYYLKCLASVLL